MAYVKDHASRHGMSSTPTYRSWQSMKNRCAGVSSLPYKKAVRYSKLGMCDRWLVFTNFLVDMGERQPGTTLERIDNEKGYEPGNCRWATAFDQQRNKRNVMMLTFNGKTQSLPAWADEIGVHGETLRHRLKYLGWSVQRTLTTPAIVGTNQWKGGA